MSIGRSKMVTEPPFISVIDLSGAKRTILKPPFVLILRNSHKSQTSIDGCPDRKTADHWKYGDRLLLFIARTLDVLISSQLFKSWWNPAFKKNNPRRNLIYSLPTPLLRNWNPVSIMHISLFSKPNHSGTSISASNTSSSMPETSFREIAGPWEGTLCLFAKQKSLMKCNSACCCSSW